MELLITRNTIEKLSNEQKNFLEEIGLYFINCEDRLPSFNSLIHFFENNPYFFQKKRFFLSNKNHPFPEIVSFFNNIFNKKFIEVKLNIYDPNAYLPFHIDMGDHDIYMITLKGKALTTFEYEKNKIIIETWDGLCIKATKESRFKYKHSVECNDNKRYAVICKSPREP